MNRRRFQVWLQTQRSRLPGVGALSYVIATWFGAGLSPIGPGTVATATVLPIYWAIQSVSVPLQCAIAVLIVGLSILTASRVVKDLGEDDPQIIVIDEVSGALIALILVSGATVAVQIVALLLFRLLDILKPWPINIRVGGLPAFGVVYDDVVAGIGAGVIARAFSELGQMAS
jgi:phosphatidylglycerophosphatase A